MQWPLSLRGILFPAISSHPADAIKAPLIIILAAWAAIFLPGLGSLELKGEEGRRILPARAMLQSGEWLVPFSEGKPYFRKPPLINWVIAASFKVCGGESEFAARLPSALSALALALTGLWAGRRIFPGASPEPARAAEPAEDEPQDGVDAHGRTLMDRLGGWPLVLALALLTSIGVVEKSRLAEIEALYVALSGMGALAWLAFHRSGAGPWLKWLSAGACFGLATLTKLPLCLLFFYPMVAVILWRTQRLRELVHPAHFAALVLTIAPWAGWNAAVKNRVAERYSSLATTSQSAVLAQQTGERFDFSRFSVSEWAGSKVPSTLLLFAPWAVLGVCFRHTVRKSRGTPETEVLPAADHAFAAGTWTMGWLVVLPFTLLPGYLSRYALPALPQMVLGAVFLAHRAQLLQPQIAARWRIGTLSLRVFFMLLSAGVFLAPWLMGMQKAVPEFLWLTALPVLWMLVLAAARLGEPLRALTTFTLICVWFSLSWAATWLPHRRQTGEDIRPPALEVLQAAGPGARIVALDPGPQPILFYLGPDCVEASRSDQLTAEFTHLLLPARRWEQEKEREKLARRDFRREILRVRDREEKEFVLVARGPE